MCLVSGGPTHPSPPVQLPWEHCEYLGTNTCPHPIPQTFGSWLSTRLAELAPGTEEGDLWSLGDMQLVGGRARAGVQVLWEVGVVCAGSAAGHHIAEQGLVPGTHSGQHSDISF